MIFSMNKNDYIVLSCIILKLATIFLTAFFMLFAATITKTNIENAVQVMEQNIFVNLLVKVNNLAAVLTMIISPAMMYSVYFVMRKYMPDKPYLVDFYVSFLLIATLADFLNDLGGVLGLLIKSGLV